MINVNGETLIEHHTKYKEIHGVDETVWLTDSEHKKLHKKLRKEGTCNVSVDVLRKISKSAYTRTEKGKKTLKDYRNSEQGKATKSKYNQSNKQKETRKKYHKNHLQQFNFYKACGEGVQLYERIGYNNKTGVSAYHSRFVPMKGYKLPMKNI